MPRFHIPAGHPRLWISPRELPAIRRASKGHRKRWRERLFKTLDTALDAPHARSDLIWQVSRPDFTALALGVAWRLTGNKKYARGAEWLLECMALWLQRGGGYDTWGMGAEASAYLYDWLHDHWQAEGRTREVAIHAAHCARRALDEFLNHYIVDDWHNYALGLQAGVLAAALAIGRDHPGIEDGELLDTMHRLHHRGYRYENTRVQDAYRTPPTTLCLDAWLRGDNGAGFAMLGEATDAYHTVDVMELLKFAVWWTALLGNGKKKVWPEIVRAGEAVLYTQQPDGHFVRIGDAAGQRPNNRIMQIMYQLNKFCPRPHFVDFLRTWDGPVNDSLPMHALLAAPKDLFAGGPKGMRRLGHNPAIGALPPSRFFNPIAVLRGGWGRDDCLVAFRCGRWGGGHNHYDMNSFSIHRGGMLALDAGYKSLAYPYKGEYYGRTLAHNAILVKNPREAFWKGRYGYPIGNDGGQRPVVHSYAPPNRLTGAPHAVLSEERRQRLRDEFDMGRTLAFEAGTRVDYVAGDATRAYTYPWSGQGDNPSRRVEEAVRQLVFLKPDLVVIFDRVEATRAAYSKTWLLHSVLAPRFRRGRSWVKAARGIHAAPAGGPFEFEHGRGRMTFWPLLPEKRRVRVLGGRGYECWVDQAPGHPRGFNAMPPHHQPENGAWRLELSPRLPARRDCFLTVIHAGLKKEPRAWDRFRFDVRQKKGFTVLAILEKDGAPRAMLRFRTRGPVAVEAEWEGERLRHNAPAPERVPRAKR